MYCRTGYRPGKGRGITPLWYATPVGGKVDYIPDGAASKNIDGVMYFFYNDVWYQPFYSGSDVVYIVAEKPAEANTQS